MKLKETSNGLYKKYIVSKANGDPIDKNAEYFILRLDYKDDDIIHVQACRDAVLFYADKIKDHLPQLSKDIFERYGKK